LISPVVLLPSVRPLLGCVPVPSVSPPIGFVALPKVRPAVDGCVVVVPSDSPADGFAAVVPKGKPAQKNQINILNMSSRCYIVKTSSVVNMSLKLSLYLLSS